ncbi:peptide-methionine (R)-S-oxide reductase MsrB [Hyphomicrobium sp. MC8b]|uniref:peptide-methionine (R)-S-oxide reductase MsrB n=1 Tax=Hyphomicrobium sp. MC8b TaxID=300273 RepID=UPI00391A3234
MYSRRDFSRLGLALAGGVAALKSATGLAAEGSAEAFQVTKSDAEWRKELTPEQYNVLRKQGTERAGTSPLDANDAPGTYLCAGCQLALFSSETKYHSGTGWPSFWKPLDGAVETSTDNSYFMTRTEVHCHRCGGHLGHVFEDGPKPTGLRYCMNGVALKFVPKVA